MASGLAQLKHADTPTHRGYLWELAGLEDLMVGMVAFDLAAPKHLQRTDQKVIIDCPQVVSKRLQHKQPAILLIGAQ